MNPLVSPIVEQINQQLLGKEYQIKITMINLLLLGYGLKFIELKERCDVFFLVLVALFLLAFG